MLSLNENNKNVVDKELKSKHKRLSIMELKSFKDFENYSDEQAEETIDTLERLSILFYDLYLKKKQREANLSASKNDFTQEEIKENKKAGSDERKTNRKKRKAA